MNFPPTSGLHHVTAISGNAARNLAFYQNLLGLKLLKKTVNFDMPTSYHLYYGDSVGTPGSLLTFFIWQGPSPGSSGRGQTLRTRFTAAGDLNDWQAQLSERGVSYET